MLWCTPVPTELLICNEYKDEFTSNQAAFYERTHDHICECLLITN